MAILHIRIYIIYDIYSFTREQLYAVVSDVEKYPSFVPWCVSTRVCEHFLSDQDVEFIQSAPLGQHNVSYVEMAAGFQALNDRYVSRVWSIENSMVKAEAIDALLFKRLVSVWKFDVPEDNPAECIVDFVIDFEFNSYLYAYIANIFFDQVARQMVRAFENRCIQIYRNDRDVQQG